MSMKKCFSGLAISLLIAGTAQAAPLEMNYQSGWNPAQRQNPDVLEPWAASFEKASNGDMKMHLFYAAGIVDTSAVFDALKSGMLDVANWSAQDIKKGPYFYMSNLPYLFRDQAHAHRAINKMYQEIPEFKADLDKPGLLLSMTASAPVQIASKDKPVHSPADLKGRRVLTIGGAFGEYVEAWGGIPVQVAIGDVYVGLQRGMGEMFICGVSCVKGARVQEFCKYSVVTGQTFSTGFPISINRELYADMTPEQQKLTRELTKNVGTDMLASFLRDVEDTYREFREAGMEVYFPNEEEMKEWRGLAMGNIERLWHHRLKDAGVKDPEMWIKKIYDFAASVE